MSTRRSCLTPAAGPLASAVLLAALLACCAPWASAADNTTNTTVISTRAVGGVAIDASGMIANLTAVERSRLRDDIAGQLAAVPEGLNAAVPMRKVSLAGIEAALRQHAADRSPIADAIQCLGGLQAVRYVIVYPEKHDIVLVGPGEGWRTAADGTLVGQTSGKPVLLLDDLMVALRAVSHPQPSVISCSIDPSQEGLARLQNVARQLTSIGNPSRTAQAVEQQLGPQQISVTGVSARSHFAQVMVAADYRMKRIGMGLEPSPVRALPSFLAMSRASGRGMSNMLPRWWMVAEYDALVSDTEGLTWELKGGRVRTKAESDHLQAQGSVERSGRADAVSQRWADLMTTHYDELAKAEPAFGQLQNCMDLAVVAALVVTKELPAKAGCELSMLMDNQPTAQLAEAKFVASKAAVMPKGRAWMIACGGVQINPWEVVGKAQQSASLATVRQEQSASTMTGWWAN